ncbi:MAG TPA: PRC-barrel domain-containing protein [Thermodesulfobacteriota bacterium]|nr:PRC-barrel domain-containing protein [Thermodesulfobacteriota bacterium]
MKKIITVAAIAGLVAFGQLGATAHAGWGKSDNQNTSINSNDQSKMHEAWVRTHELSKLKGKDVKSTEGKKIGSIKDFLIDDQGRVQFALLDAGKTVAVPFEALNLSNDGKFYSLNINKDQLASAPQFNDKTVVDRSWTDSVYRFFGVQPRWSDEQGKMNSSSSMRNEGREDLSGRTTTGTGEDMNRQNTDQGTPSGTTGR